MERHSRRSFIVLIAALAAIATLGNLEIGRAEEENENRSLRAHIVATGIPGASAISAVGTFLPGGPIHDRPGFTVYTQPGRVLDPVRILVGSTSNFGAPLARSDQEEGSFISIDPHSETLVIPSDFAAAGGQASVLGGRVQMYSAQSPAFLNSINNPSAVTANFTGVSNPLGLSINNAFGRLWPANAPAGLDGIGTSTVLDPNGVGLAGAPNPGAGGVFAGNLNPRQPQLLAGTLTPGAVGTAFLGKSPDGSIPRRAVFSVVLADGSIVQVHVLKGVDGLAPGGTVSPLLGRRWDEGEEEEDGRGASPRLGVILNYSPSRILYVSEPFENSIAAIDLADDGVIFRVAGLRRFCSKALNRPIDLAPATVETSDLNWSSNTTLDVGAEFYVANRGNNTIIRMRQDGTVVAVRRVLLVDGRPLGNARLNGIAVSPDGTTIWVTVTGHLLGERNGDGAVLELPAFQN
jgi:hypothetical protein